MAISASCQVVPKLQAPTADETLIETSNLQLGILNYFPYLWYIKRLSLFLLPAGETGKIKFSMPAQGSSQ
jgi:hypothetical protein